MKKLEALAASIFGLAFLVLAVAVTAETIMRKVFNQSLQGVDELGGYILALAGAMSLSVALVARAHIRIDIVHDNLPAPALAAQCAREPLDPRCAIALLRMAWFAYDESAALGATAQTPWATPLKYPQALWVVAMVPFLLVCASRSPASDTAVEARVQDHRPELWSAHRAGGARRRTRRSQGARRLRRRGGPRGDLE